MLLLTLAPLLSKGLLPNFRNDILNEGIGIYNRFLTINNASQCSDVRQTYNKISTLCLLKKKNGWEYNTHLPESIDIYAVEPKYDLLSENNIPAITNCQCNSFLLWSKIYDDVDIDLTEKQRFHWARTFPSLLSSETLKGSDLKDAIPPDRTEVSEPEKYSFFDVGPMHILKLPDNRYLGGWTFVRTSSSEIIEEDFDRNYLHASAPERSEHVSSWWIWTIATYIWAAKPSRASAILELFFLVLLLIINKTSLGTSNIVLLSLSTFFLLSTVIAKPSKHIFLMLCTAANVSIGILIHRLSKHPKFTIFSTTLTELLISWLFRNATISLFTISNKIYNLARVALVVFQSQKWQSE